MVVTRYVFVICAAAVVVASVQPVLAVNNNGWDTDYIYTMRDGQIRVAQEGTGAEVARLTDPIPDPPGWLDHWATLTFPARGRQAMPSFT